MVQNQQASIGIVRRRAVDQRKQDACYHLEHEQHRSRAAKDVPPACVAGGRGMLRGFGERLDESEAMFKPSIALHCGFHSALLQACHEDLASAVVGAMFTSGFLPHDACVARVGMSPAWMTSACPTTLYLYSKSPRSGGPEARSPVA